MLTPGLKGHRNSLIPRPVRLSKLKSNESLKPSNQKISRIGRKIEDLCRKDTFSGEIKTFMHNSSTAIMSNRQRNYHHVKKKNKEFGLMTSRVIDPG